MANFGQVLAKIADLFTQATHAITDHTGITGVGGGAHNALTGLTTGDPHTQYQQESEKAAANGYASLGANSLVPVAQLGTGTPSASTFLRGDQVYAAAGDPWTETVVNLTDAQIKTLFSAPVQIGAAPGANLIYQVEIGTIALDNAAGVYVGGGDVQLRINGRSLGILSASSFFTADAAASKARWMLPISGNVAIGIAFVAADVNTALTIGMTSADFTGGNAANKATVTVRHRAVSTLPN